jgi:hypothetical protein
LLKLSFIILQYYTHFEDRKELKKWITVDREFVFVKDVFGERY